MGDLTQATFTRLNMPRTRLTFRNGEDSNVADSWNDKGEPQPHDKRSKVRAAALVTGDGHPPPPAPKSPNRASTLRPQTSSPCSGRRSLFFLRLA